MEWLLEVELLLLQVQAHIRSALNFGAYILASCRVRKQILAVDNRVVVVGIVYIGGGVE